VYIFVGEAPTGWAMIGAAIVISAIFLHTLKMERAEAV
jgi:drug/metabolite transporter (DMT)-like permease